MNNPHEFEFLIREAIGLFQKRIDMLKHGFSIQETDLTEIMDLLKKTRDCVDIRGKSSGDRGRLDR